METADSKKVSILLALSLVLKTVLVFSSNDNNALLPLPKALGLASSKSVVTMVSANWCK